MLFGTGVISDRQFIKHLGKNIFIWPFNPANLKGSTYNLTASKIAYYKENGENISVIDQDDVINIPEKKTVLIQTEESIYVTKNICGTYHAKVKMVSKGLSSISTTLDPYYFGTSLIAVTNLSDKTIKINSGETFCSLMLYKMRGASYEKHDNLPFRSDISSNIINKFIFLEKNKCNSCTDFDSCENKLRYNDENIKDIKKEFTDWFNQDFRKNRNDLIEKVKYYKKNEINKKYINFIYSILTILFVTIAMFLLYRYLSFFRNSESRFLGLTYDTIFSYLILPLTIGAYKIIFDFFKI